MSYCGNCGFDDQWSDEMKDVECQRCGAVKHSSGSVSYGASNGEMEEMNHRIRDFDKGQF